MKMAEEDRLFTVKRENYRGTVSPEEMDYEKMTTDEKIAYLEARNAYLEHAMEAQKKIRSELAAKYISSKKTV
jgi:hypothetical protein